MAFLAKQPGESMLEWLERIRKEAPKQERKPAAPVQQEKESKTYAPTAGAQQAASNGTGSEKAAESKPDGKEQSTSLPGAETGQKKLKGPSVDQGGNESLGTGKAGVREWRSVMLGKAEPMGGPVGAHGTGIQGTGWQSLQMSKNCENLGRPHDHAQMLPMPSEYAAGKHAPFSSKPGRPPITTTTTTASIAPAPETQRFEDPNMHVRLELPTERIAPASPPQGHTADPPTPAIHRGVQAIAPAFSSPLTPPSAVGQKQQLQVPFPTPSSSNNPASGAEGQKEWTSYSISTPPPPITPAPTTKRRKVVEAAQDDKIHQDAFGDEFFNSQDTRSPLMPTIIQHSNIPPVSASQLDIVNIITRGSAEDKEEIKSFSLHLNILRLRCPYLYDLALKTPPTTMPAQASALRQREKPGPKPKQAAQTSQPAKTRQTEGPRTLKLLHYSTTGFKIFVAWLYAGSVDLWPASVPSIGTASPSTTDSPTKPGPSGEKATLGAPSSSDPGHLLPTLLRAYTLSLSLQTPSFANALLARVCRLSTIHGLVFDNDIINAIYRSTPPGCALRKWIVDEWVWQFGDSEGVDQLEWESECVPCNGFLFDCVVELAGRVGGAGRAKYKHKAPADMVDRYMVH
jgi:hypothetical protein